MSDNLRPCPHCGGVLVEMRQGLGEFWGHCPECHSSSGASSDRVDAVSRWNRRPSEQQPAEPRVEALVDALRLILPLAKGYAPAGQTDAAKRACRERIEAAETALAALPATCGGEEDLASRAKSAARVSDHADQDRSDPLEGGE